MNDTSRFNHPSLLVNYNRRHMPHLPFHVNTTTATDKDDNTTIFKGASTPKTTTRSINSQLESNDYGDTTGGGLLHHHRRNGNELDVMGHYIHHSNTTTMTAAQGEERDTMTMHEESKAAERVSRDLSNLRDEIDDDDDDGGGGESYSKLLSLSNVFDRDTTSTTNYTSPSTMIPSSLEEEVPYCSVVEGNTAACQTTTTSRIDMTPQFYDHDTNDEDVELPTPITPYDNDTHDHSKPSANTNLADNAYTLRATMNIPTPLPYSNCRPDDGEGKWKDSVSDDVTVSAGNRRHKQDMNPSNIFSFPTYSNDVVVDTGGSGGGGGGDNRGMDVGRPVSEFGSPKGGQDILPTVQTQFPIQMEGRHYTTTATITTPGNEKRSLEENYFATTKVPMPTSLPYPRSSLPRSPLSQPFNTTSYGLYNAAIYHNHNYLHTMPPQYCFDLSEARSNCNRTGGAAMHLDIHPQQHQTYQPQHHHQQQTSMYLQNWRTQHPNSTVSQQQQQHGHPHHLTNVKTPQQPNPDTRNVRPYSAIVGNDGFALPNKAYQRRRRSKYMNHSNYSPATPTPYNGTSSTAIISPLPATSKGSAPSSPSSFYPKSPHHHHHHHQANPYCRWLPPLPPQLHSSRHPHHHPFIVQGTPMSSVSSSECFTTRPDYRDIVALKYRNSGYIIPQTRRSGGTGGDVSAFSSNSLPTAGGGNYSRKEKSLGLLASKIIRMYEGQTARIEGKIYYSGLNDRPYSTTNNVTTSKKRKCEKGHSSSSSLLSTWYQEEDDETMMVVPKKFDHDRTRSPSIERDNMKKSDEEQKQRSPTKPPILSIDQTASQLRVERRRIYDIINILEALSIVSKKGKNLYWWYGLQGLEATFSRLQSEAMKDEDGLLIDAERNGMFDNGDEMKEDSTRSGRSNVGAVGYTSSKISAESNDYDTGNKEGPQSSRRACTGLLHTGETHTQFNSTSSTGDRDNNATNSKCSTTFGSLGLLSKRFLELYLVGYNSFSLGDATVRLLGDGIYPGAEHPEATINTDDTMNTKRGGDESRGFKTKVRRLYDIANVFVSIGMIKKTTNQPSPSSFSTNSTTASSNHSRMNVGRDGRNLVVPLHKNNQYYCWNYAVTPRELLGASRKRERITGLSLLVVNKYVE